MYSNVALVISLLAAASAAVLAKKRERSPALWMLLCFFCPLLLPYLVQLRHGEKPTRDILTRCAIAILLFVFFYFGLTPNSTGKSIIPSYESLILSNISSVLDLFRVTHFRDGSFFKTPSMTFDIPNGAPLFYYSFAFAAMAAILSVFLRNRQPYMTLGLMIAFFSVGHLASVGAVAMIAATFDNPAQLTKQTMVLIGDVCKSSCLLLLYTTVLAIAFRSSHRGPNPRVALAESRSPA